MSYRIAALLALLGSPALIGCQSTTAQEAVTNSQVFEVVQLRNAVACELSIPLSRVFSGSSLRVQCDPRTNSILLAGSPTEISQALETIAELDVAVD